MKQSEFAMRSAFVRLCPSVNQLVECKLGKKCVMEHDLSAFLSKKPKDIGNICPVYEARGSCPYNYACRFGDAHIDSHGNQVSKTPAIPYQQSRNGLSMHIQVAIRKKNFDFQRSYKYIDCCKTRAAVSGLKSHVLICKIMYYNGMSYFQVLEIMKADSVGAMEREKPKLDMKTLRGKKYLAPLTTVGNLPFRRLCVELGADITCTEMILATNLLSGYSSEYALLKRHSSEKLFGVQLAGGFADSMTKSAQILVDEMDIDFIDVNMGCPIDLVNQKGGGCALPNRPGKMVEVLSALRLVMKDIPLTVKLRSGIKADVLTADETITSMVANSKPDLITLHPRSKEQRYSKLANWSFVKPCIDACKDVPLWVCGDVLSWEDYYAVCCFHNEF
ncbi:dihydrouridine synthase [Dictyocaulus viviparus]|uniref:tRNA-dihydrouridine(47) synthase [NAD(P)(+)] n=1 Tax=Dictyocaulus viviparus TaxID=29172 RepID=A0A0D8Y983_DICVI|nr:dihydrouridine synthase [Dictyocaulus viviparus]